MPEAPCSASTATDFSEPHIFRAGGDLRADFPAQL